MNDPGLVSSASNPVAKRIRRLADRKHRRAENAAVVTGLQPVWRAVDAGIEMDTMVVAPSLLHNASALAMVDRLERDGVRTVRFTGELFARVSDRDGPTGLAAIVRQRTWDLDDLAPGPDSTFVALHRIANPGNLGTILRTADATEASGVLLVGDATDPYDPASVKASMGAVFTVPVAKVADLATLFEWAAAHQLAVAATSPTAGAPLWQAAIRPPLVVLMGSEGSGLDDETLVRGTLRLSIPMLGSAESLNLAVATGVILYDLWRRRSESTGRC